MSASSYQSISKFLYERKCRQSEHDRNGKKIYTLISEVPANPRVTLLSGEKKRSQKEERYVCYGANGSGHADDDGPADEGAERFLRHVRHLIGVQRTQGVRIIENRSTCRSAATVRFIISVSKMPTSMRNDSTDRQFE